MNTINIFSKRKSRAGPKSPRYATYYRSSYGPEVTNTNKSNVINSLLCRIANVVATHDIRHVNLDPQGEYASDKDSSLNQILKYHPNEDQTGRQLLYDAVLTMLDSGSSAIVPIQYNNEVIHSKTPDGAIELQNVLTIKDARVGKIVGWYHNFVDIDIFNERTQVSEMITVPKSTTVILENPFYAIMNQNGSYMRKLVDKMNQYDRTTSTEYMSGQLDIIIKVPFDLGDKKRTARAEMRRKEIENQLKKAEYGIAYIGDTEDVIQLNRPSINNLSDQIDKLYTKVLAQLGISEEILKGTASEQELTTFQEEIIYTILNAVIDQMNKKWIPKNQTKEAICYKRDIFKYTPTSKVAEVSEKLINAEIVTPNEVRPHIGYARSDQKNADELLNRNTINRNRNASVEQKEEIINET